MLRPVPALVICLVECLTVGCAGHRAPDTASPFVIRSHDVYKDGATYDVPSTSGTSPTQAKSPSAPTTAVPSIPKGPVSKTSGGPTLESTSNELSAALTALKEHRSAESYAAVGEAYHHLGVLDMAETNFQRALKMNSRLPQANEGLARVWRDWGLPQEGLGYAHRAVSDAPKSPSAHNTLGTLLFVLGNPEQARAEFDKALALDPSAAYALNNLCYVAFMLGDAGPAAARCTEALALNPASSTTRNNLGLIYAAEGRNDDAKREFEKAGGDSSALYNMGIVHMSRREYKDAIAPFVAACNAKPEVAGACAWAKEARKLAANPPKGGDPD